MKIIKDIHDVDTRYEFIRDFKNTDFLDKDEVSMLKSIFKNKDVLYIFYKGFNYSITRNIKRFKREENSKLDLSHITNLLKEFADPKHNKRNKS